MKTHLILATALLSLTETVLSKERKSLVVSAPESSTRGRRSVRDEDGDSVNPRIDSLEIHSAITQRYATTVITSRVTNWNRTAAETTFSVVLPETAFISSFSMEIGGEIYRARVEEKQEAQSVYDEARLRGLNAAHVAAQDSKTFAVSVNIEPRTTVSFELTYEELLRRERGRYEHVVHINPGQLVEDMDVEVAIRENRPLAFVRVPPLRTGEVGKKEGSEPSAAVRLLDARSAVMKFHPDRRKQRNLALLLGTRKEYGLAGKFVVHYDVERDPGGGEVLVRDGYFVHFFAPPDLRPLPKHVVLVLDYSASMKGTKIDQVVDAMKNVLSELGEGDLFTIVRFHTWTSVWDAARNRFREIKLWRPNYGHLEARLRTLNLPTGAKATPENIKKAKRALDKHGFMGWTNMIEGLEVGLFIVNRTRRKDRRHQSMMIFLTDGLPTEGMDSGEIIETVTKLNNNQTSLFSLSFGGDADKRFLEELSLKNLGFCRHIFEGADASLQLQNFYRTISSPLLSNVTFQYVGGVREVTQNWYPLFFKDSELVVAGRIGDEANISFEIYGTGIAGFVGFRPVEEKAVGSMERLWAYLTVRQLLENDKNATKRALDLSLKYSFVTELTSLVVVKEEKKPSVDENRDENEVGSGLDPDFDPDDQIVGSGASNLQMDVFADSGSGSGDG